jgi:sulfhydrogenase subunit beta (sulfur reductase)
MAHLLAREKLSGWLLKLAEGKTLIAPTAAADGRTAFAEVADPEQISVPPGALNDSAKVYFFPPSHEMFRFSGKGATFRMGCGREDITPLILFGLRPCDALAISQSDRFWSCDEGDPYYAERRALSTIVALNCDTAVPECFCESISQALSLPRGMDVLLTPLGEKAFLVESFSEIGEQALAATAEFLTEASEADVAARATLAEKVGGQQTRSIDREHITEAFQARFKDAAFWKQHTSACIGCGVCTYLCPTCTCFDVLDDAIGPNGYRYRCWDSCQFRHFCEEASGHDRRPQQWERQRQRLGHKLWYSVERFGEISCVGCGRCIRLCPVNIDISRIAAACCEPVEAVEEEA